MKKWYEARSIWPHNRVLVDMPLADAAGESQRPSKRSKHFWEISWGLQR